MKTISTLENRRKVATDLENRIKKISNILTKQELDPYTINECKVLVQTLSRTVQRLHEVYYEILLEE